MIILLKKSPISPAFHAKNQLFQHHKSQKAHQSFAFPWIKEHLLIKGIYLQIFFNKCKKTILFCIENKFLKTICTIECCSSTLINIKNFILHFLGVLININAIVLFFHVLSIEIEQSNILFILYVSKVIFNCLTSHFHNSIC